MEVPSLGLANNMSRLKRKLGQKKGWTAKEVNAIARKIRTSRSLQELAIFHTAIDTMLRVSDIVRLKVDDVMYASGEIKEVYLIRQMKTGEKVEVVLHPPTRTVLKEHITKSKKSFTDYLFTRLHHPEQHISPRWMNELIKTWVKLIKLNPEEYSCHSARRTGAIHLFIKSG